MPAAFHAALPPLIQCTGMSVSAWASSTARLASRPSSEVRNSARRTGNFGIARERRPRMANHAPGMLAGRQIDDGDVVDLENSGNIDRGIDRRPAEDHRLRLAGFRTRLGQYENIPPAHLLEPGSGHERAHLLVVTQNDSGSERAGVAIRSLHQLAAKRGDGAGEVAGRVFGRLAHVENVGRSPFVMAPSLDGGAVDR